MAQIDQTINGNKTFTVYPEKKGRAQRTRVWVYPTGWSGTLTPTLRPDVSPAAAGIAVGYTKPANWTLDTTAIAPALSNTPALYEFLQDGAILDLAFTVTAGSVRVVIDVAQDS